MKLAASGTFLKEFTLIAEEASDSGETFLIQRPNGKNVILMSQDAYNDLRRRIYQAEHKND